MKKLLSCVLVFMMILGTCTTSFATFLTDAEVAYVDGIVDSAKEEIDKIIDLAENGTDAQKMEKVNEYINAVKEALVEAGLDEVTIAKVEAEIRAEVAEIMAIVETQNDAAAKDKIDAYIDYIKGALNITAEDEAKVAETIADITALVEKIQGISVEDVKSEIDAYIAELKAKAALEYAKLGHKHYEANDDSLYVAIGAPTVVIDEDITPYFDLVAQNYDIDWSFDDVANADLITYQVDAADVLLGILETEVEWNKYFSAEQLAVVDAVWEKAAEIIAMDWEAVGADHSAKLAAEIKAAVLENLPAEIEVNEADVDNVINFCMPYIGTALSVAEGMKDEAVEAIPEVDDMVLGIAEKLAFAVVSYVVDTKAAIENIQAINPDATLVVLGMYNNFDGVEVAFDGTTIDLGEYFAYVVDVTNIYYNVLSAVNGGFAFVNIDEADVNGTTISVEGIANAVANITANADGHVYIKDQIIKALTCDYSVCEMVDADYHAIKCSICDAIERTEEHTWDGNTCTGCGYTKVVVPTPTPDDPTPTPTPSRPSSGGGGGGIISNYTIKFETNGGSKIDSVKVEKDGFLSEPAAPTKDGYTFAGWYTDKELTNKYDFSQKVTKSFTLYAKWIEAEFKSPFGDVTKGDWFYDAVMFVLKKGITNGVSDTSYDPQGKVTRGQFITMLCRAYEVKEMSGDNFADCGNTWYTGYLAAAKQLGISNGVGDNMFAPEKEITREEMVALIYNYLKSIDKVADEASELSFADSDSVSEWAETAVAYAAKNGIVNGKGNNLFDPNGTATRAELAQIFYNMFK